MVDTKDYEFIFKFVEQAWINRTDLFFALHRKNSVEMIEQACKASRFTQNDLVMAASSIELMCSLADLFKLLDKIKKQRDQEKAIGDGVSNIFDKNRVDCLDPLLNALEHTESLHHLKGAAVKSAFVKGSKNGDKSIVERFYDDPAVTSQIYAQGLLDSGSKSTQGPAFIFLLGEADRDDLNAVKENRKYGLKSYAFKDAIENALLTAKPGGSRPNIRDNIQRVKLIMKIFAEEQGGVIGPDVSELIVSYLVDKSIVEENTNSKGTSEAICVIL